MSADLERPIFADPTGRRARRSALLATLAVGAVVLLAIGFLLSVLVPPRLPRAIQAKRMRPAAIPAPHKSDAAYAAQIERPLPGKAKIARGRRIVAAYVPTWNPLAIPSLESHAKPLTVVFPTFLTLRADGTIGTEPSATPERARRIAEIARSSDISLEPILANAAGGNFSAESVIRMLSSPKASDAVAADLAGRVAKYGWNGLQVDFEGLENPADLLRYADWLKGLKRRMGPSKRLSISLEPDVAVNSPRAARALGAAADLVVAMAYDEHEDQSEPGAIASLRFVRDTVRTMTNEIPAEKLLLGVGTYGYDWTRHSAELEPGDSGYRGVAMTYQEAITAAAGYRDGDPAREVIDFDDRSRNPHFDYEDDEDVHHDVWFQNAATAYNAVRIAAPYGLKGVALWSLGGEDPGVWDAVTEADPKPAALAKSRVANIAGEIKYVGEGEILRVEKEGSQGMRTFGFDDNGFVDEMSVTEFPTGMVVHRYGARRKEIALTFDDGPDPTWTPRILDALARLKVPGSFFVIGEQAARDPGLVARMVNEGHDVGSHSFSHPNLGVVAPERVRLELDATQRAIEAATGRSTILFRPPYNADSTPQTAVEMRPVLIGSQKGYLTVGESIDPEDWLIRTPSGRVRTAREIADETVAKVAEFERIGANPENQSHPADGAAILLHDGGGDRSRTLEALPLIVDALRAKGYTFVTTGALLGVSRDRAMPPLTGRQRLVAMIDGLSFRLSNGFESLLMIAFSAAIVLGVGRALLVSALAAAHARRRPAPPLADPPPVAVLVAAYNEEKVIERTIRSILDAEYGPIEVVVVDDGSKDGTADVVEAAFADEPRVKLLRKPNGGKASALNLALSATHAPIVVGVDADTQLPPDAIGLLVAPLADERLGMTAGNVKVGNVGTAVTQWQDVEYTTSQNLDRRAYALLNCITVVPGAIGAWRREAVIAAGGYETDTLAEDMDLTWRMRRAGWRAETVPAARAYTEAPETVRAFLKQRFRWTFGTLQCLWKHRRAVGRYGWFGGFALPALWVFQIGVQVIAPFVDLQVLWSVVAAIYSFADPVRPAVPGGKLEWDPRDDAIRSLVLVLASFAAFLLVELATGFVAYRMDRESPRPLVWLPLQRLVYRQIMYVVVWRSLVAALKGARHGWGKLDRTARVRLSSGRAR